MQTNAKTARPGAERKRPDRKPKKQAPARKTGPQTAQQTIPYREIFKDGICRVNDRLYTKSMEYEDIMDLDLSIMYYFFSPHYCHYIKSKV